MTRSTSREETRSTSQIAQQILVNPRIALATTHSSGHVDNAHARANINDTAAGREAHRSSYTEGGSTAPGGTVALQESMLSGLQTLGAEFTFTVSEIAGGVHSSNSRHYVGVAFDISILNGVPVNATNPHVGAFKARGAALGATEVLGPGDPGHATHVHLAWPRP